MRPDLSRWEVLLPDAGAPALADARRLLRAALAGIDGPDRDDIVLAADELLANAIDHGDGPRALRVTFTGSPARRVVVEVDDNNHHRPVPGTSRLGPDRGRGVLIVAHIADEWGVRPAPEGKTVWFSRVLLAPPRPI